MTKRKLAFEVTSKRRKGYPSETQVKRGTRIVHGNKELIEKLGRKDRCPCGSGKSFQEMLSTQRPVLMAYCVTAMNADVIWVLGRAARQRTFNPRDTGSTPVGPTSSIPS